jgi:hypothetical protein
MSLTNSVFNLESGQTSLSEAKLSVVRPDEALDSQGAQSLRRGMVQALDPSTATVSQ